MTEDPPDNGLLKSTTTEDVDSLRANFREQLKPWPENYPEENIYRERMRAHLNHAAALLVKEANAMGFVLTISQHPVGPIPAIGRTTTAISVTSKRFQAS